MAAPQQTNAESALIPNVTAITVAQQMQLIQEQTQLIQEQTQASFDQVQASLDHIQASLDQIQASLDQTLKQMDSCKAEFAATTHSLDALPARIINFTREPHLPLFYLGLTLPNDAAWPTGPGGPMPWSKLDIVNYDETQAAAALAALGLPVNPQNTLALRKRSLARFFGFNL